MRDDLIGRSIAHYRITARIGAGGMGEVYRATDSKLRREVAIKVLPEAVSGDPDRLARFEREAHLLASLNHAHIAVIHGLEEVDGSHALVMELVEGPTLAERLRAGPLPLDEALPVARQIAAALEAAHEKGIVHRDLKPGNIKLTPDGEVKVLDFGLAKALGPGPGLESDLSASPTLTYQATNEGVVLGTAAYMAPEQAKGKAVDRRADIWAFGAVLWECLTGKRLFAGDSVAETLSNVITRDPDLAELPPETPPSVVRLLRRCLVRDPRNRLHDIGDARIVLEEAVAGGGEEADSARLAPVAPPLWRRALPGTMAVLAIAAVAVGWWITRGGTATRPQIGPGTPAKSIAVLPFENLSDDKQNAYFVAGIQDLILTKLAGIGDLKVISRTSTEEYESTPDNLQEVAAELGVVNVLEGSVQKIGDEVLINVQLIDARTDTHLWAESYQRTLENIFGVEGEVAGKIAAALDAELSPAQSAQLVAVPTTDKAAYDLFLRAEYHVNRGLANLNSSTADLEAAIPLYRQAIELDSGFALAYARLSYVEDALAWFGGGGESPKQLFAQARADAERALELAPELAAAHVAMGYSEYYGRGDYAAALEAFDAALARSPNDAEALAARGFVERRQGRFEAAIASLQEALEHDPRNSRLAFDIGATSMMVNRFAEAETWLRRALALDPNNVNAKLTYSDAILFGSGDVPRALAAAQGDAPGLKLQRMDLLTYQRKFREAIALLESIPDTPDIFYVDIGSKALNLAELYRWAGNVAKARTLFEQALPQSRAQLERQRGIVLGYVWHDVARAKVGLGHTAEGLDAIAEVQAIVARSEDQVGGPILMASNARLYAEAGRPDLAVPLLARALATSGIGLSYAPVMLWLDPYLDPIRDDPRFQALLAKYAEHKPAVIYYSLPSGAAR